MSFTGTGDGVEINHASALASAGNDLFSLAYFAYPGVPDSLIDIDLQYFEECSPYAPEFRKVLDDEDVPREKSISIEIADDPILLIFGLDDQMLDCAWGSDQVVNRLRAHNYQHHYEHCALRETGHMTPVPNTIATFFPALYHTLAEVFLACGGTQEGTALQSKHMWNTKLAHFERVFADA